jgi:hypothetical protein
MQLPENPILQGLIALVLCTIAIMLMMGFGNLLGSLLWGPI